MVDWLNEFAEKQGQTSKKMVKKASSNRIIVDKSKFAKAANNEIVSYKGASYKVVDASYSDNKGKGVLLERVADLVGGPMEVAIGTAEDYVIGNDDFGAQEYARTNPEIQDTDPQAEEVAKFEEEAAQTADAIAQEDAIDGTSGATRPNRILMKLVEKYAPIYAPVETSIVEEINTEVAVEEPVCEDEECIIDEFTEEDFEGLFDDTVEEPVAVEEPIEIPEFVDEEEIEVEDVNDEDVDDEEVDDIAIEDERENEEIKTPDTTLEASRKSNRIAKKMR